MKKKISFISQPEYFRFIYEDYLNDIFEVREFPLTFDMRPENFDSLIDYNADYNFFFRGEFFPQDVLTKLKGKKIALSSEPFPRKIGGKWEYTKDSIKRYLTFRSIRQKSFDYIFHYDVSSLPLFQRDGLQISGEFVFPVALNKYKPEKKEKKWDLFFIGRSSNYRDQYFNYLKHHYKFLHIAHGVWGPELVDYVNSSKICLNVHAEPEISWEPRMQMLLACGAFMISQKLTPNEYLRPKIDYIEFIDADDLYKKVEYYLKSEIEREKISQNALDTISKHFDAKIKFIDLIKNIEDEKYPTFKALSKKSALINFLNLILKS